MQIVTDLCEIAVIFALGKPHSEHSQTVLHVARLPHVQALSNMHQMQLKH